MPAILDKILRIGEGKILRQLESITRAVNAIEDDFVAMSDEELQGQTALFKQRLADGRGALVLDLAHRVGVGRVDQPRPTAEAAQHGLDADAGLGGDVVEGDLHQQPGGRQGHHRVEDGEPGPLRGLGPSRHGVGARSFHVSGSSPQ